MYGEMSNKIRTYAESRYVIPAKREGRRRFAIPVRDVWNSLVESGGLPRQNVPQICQALRSSRKFLDPLGLEIEKVEGPEKQTSTTVVFHYRFRGEPTGDRSGRTVQSSPEPAEQRSPEAALARMRGLMRDEFAAYGGGEAFLKWLRTDPEKDRR